MLSSDWAYRHHVSSFWKHGVPHMFTFCVKFCSYFTLLIFEHAFSLLGFWCVKTFKRKIQLIFFLGVSFQWHHLFISCFHKKLYALSQLLSFLIIRIVSNIRQTLATINPLTILLQYLIFFFIRNELEISLILLIVLLQMSATMMIMTKILKAPSKCFSFIELM